MRKILLTMSILTIGLIAGAQTSFLGNKLETDKFMIDANGRLMKPNRSFDEEGSPYNTKEFMEGTVTLGNGNTYKGLSVRINFLSNEVEFIDNTGNEMVIALPVKEVQVKTPDGIKVYRAGFSPVEDREITAFYEVLDSGSALLLKYAEVKFSERQPYPNARFVRTYRDRTLYYMSTDGKSVKRMPKDAVEIPALLGGQQKEMMGFIQKESIKLKREDDMIKLFRHYNSLTKG